MLVNNRKWYREERLRTSEWLLNIPDKNIRLRALSNSISLNSPLKLNYSKSNNLSEAIFNAFIWEDTREGADFWRDYNDTVRKNLRSINLNDRMKKRLK